MYEKNSYLYFRWKEIKKLYCFCLYGLNDNSFKEKTIDEKGNTHYISRIDKNYFYNFSDKITKETYNMTDENRKTVVLIKNPDLFFEK